MTVQVVGSGFFLLRLGEEAGRSHLISRQDAARLHAELGRLLRVERKLDLSGLDEAVAVEVGAQQGPTGEPPKEEAPKLADIPRKWMRPLHWLLLGFGKWINRNQTYR